MNIPNNIANTIKGIHQHMEEIDTYALITIDHEIMDYSKRTWNDKDIMYELDQLDYEIWYELKWREGDLMDAYIEDQQHWDDLLEYVDECPECPMPATF